MLSRLPTDVDSKFFQRQHIDLGIPQIIHTQKLLIDTSSECSTSVKQNKQELGEADENQKKAGYPAPSPPPQHRLHTRPSPPAVTALT